MEDESEYFDTLLAHIEERRVVPVIGADLLAVTYRGQTMPLYEAVARQFLELYSRAGTVELPPGHELHAAVCAVLDDRRRDPYSVLPRALNAVLKDTLDEVMQPLRDLASIDAFSLFVTTTIDDLLVRAIDAVRHGGMAKTRSIVHAPNLPTEEFRDVTDSDLCSAQFTAVLHLFGKARSAQLYALHDEDTLEYVHNLQTRGSNVPERFIAKLRSYDLLLIGCSLPDWLSRFVLRLSSQSRLGDDQRPKREFLVENVPTGGDPLVVFLERFSRQTAVFQRDPRQFVAELARRWRESHPTAEGSVTAAATKPARAAEDTVFISYSRGDFAAAQRLRDDLQKIGIDGVWFDHAQLEAGHDWQKEIAKAIKRCYLFLPLISAGTESRDEGYFREEWQQAAERARQIEGRTFIVPVVIDPAYGGDGGAYRLVPDAFPRKHFGHAPDGRMNDALRERLVALIREYRLTKVA